MNTELTELVFILDRSRDQWVVWKVIRLAVLTA